MQFCSCMAQKSDPKLITTPLKRHHGPRYVGWLWCIKIGQINAHFRSQFQALFSRTTFYLILGHCVLLHSPKFAAIYPGCPSLVQYLFRLILGELATVTLPFLLVPLCTTQEFKHRLVSLIAQAAIHYRPLLTPGALNLGLIPSANGRKLHYTIHL